MAAQKRSTNSQAARRKQRPSRSSASRSGSSRSVMTLPVLHSRVHLPAPEDVAYYGAIGLLAALEIVEWPVAVIIAGGHLLASRSRNQLTEGLGQGAEDA